MSEIILILAMFAIGTVLTIDDINSHSIEVNKVRYMPVNPSCTGVVAEICKVIAVILMTLEFIKLHV